MSSCIRDAFRKVSHVIFDMDGLLLDTERLYTEATQNIIGQYGQTYDWNVKNRIMGFTGAEAAEMIVDAYQLPISAEEYNALAHEQYATLMPGAKLMPGADRVVRHLIKHQIPCAVATSSSEQSFTLKTKSHREFFSMFEHIVTGGSDPDVKRGKPSPDIFKVCAERFRDKPKYEDCLVFEDAPNGVKGAKAAGMQTVMVPDEHTNMEMCTHATIVYKSLNDFQPELFGLPKFEEKL